MKFISIESDKGFINDVEGCLPNIEIPSYVRVIGPATFEDQTVLRSVKMNSGLQTISSQAFFLALF